MNRVLASTTILAALGVLGSSLSDYVGSRLQAAGDPHAYFNSLVRRGEHWTSYSFRDPGQLASNKAGGLAQLAPAEIPSVTYDPSGDDDRHRQDAAKVVIGAFSTTGRLAQPSTATATVLTLEDAYRPLYGSGRTFKIDKEIMVVTQWLTDTTISVSRGSHGTVAAAHLSGARLQHSTNSLKSQLRLPLGTEDGHDYFFTWDAYWTDSYVGAGRFNHKAFQFSSGGRDGDTIFFEPQVSYSPGRSRCFDPNVHVASFQVRSYNKVGGGPNWSSTDGNSLGPTGTGPYPLGPSVEYCIEVNKWTRFFVHLRQRANDYDLVDMWLADETREPVKVLLGVPISVRPTGLNPNSITKFWVEFNSSEDELYRTDGRDLVNYVRNFVALRDIGNPQSLLVRPVAGAEVEATGPAAPRGIRIIQR